MSTISLVGCIHLFDSRTSFNQLDPYLDCFAFLHQKLLVNIHSNFLLTTHQHTKLVHKQPTSLVHDQLAYHGIKAGRNNSLSQHPTI